MPGIAVEFPCTTPPCENHVGGPRCYCDVCMDTLARHFAHDFHFHAEAARVAPETWFIDKLDENLLPAQAADLKSRVLALCTGSAQ